MATSTRVNINDPKNYKACRKKQYEIWACIPPAGTILVNKLEQVDVVKQLNGKTFFTLEEQERMKAHNPQGYAFIMQLVQQGLVYYVKAGTVVLSGTRGELWTTSAEKAAQKYQVFFNGAWCNNWAAVMESRGIKTSNEMLLPWIKIHANGDVANSAFACFVPLSQKEQIKTSWALLRANLPGCEHGLGDFIIAGRLPNGQVNMNDRYIVNGAVFADTYNNQGWSDCLKNPGVDVNAPEPAPLFHVENTAEAVDFDKDLFNYVGSVATQCAMNQHKELAFRIGKGKKDNEFLIDAKTIVDFASKNSTSEFKVVGIRTTVTVNPDNTVTFANNMISEYGGANESYRITAPNGVAKGAKVDPSVTKKFVLDNAEIIFGLCGFVREVGVKGSFRSMAPIEKSDYDGIREYTMTSGATNRLLRGLSYADERSGEGHASPIRTVANCDAFFSKVATTRPLRVFRGEPFSQRVADNGARFGDLTGFQSVNTAYTSTTLNVQSAPMFSKCDDIVQGVKGGIIWAIDLPAGVNAYYSHNVAGWMQQYEIILDRKYDIVAGETLLQFDDTSGHTYKVVRGQLVPHASGGALDTVQSAMLYKAGKRSYDMYGRVPFEREYTDGVLHQAFTKIRERGYSDVQWQKEYDSTNDIPYSNVNNKSVYELTDAYINVKAAIILRVNNPDTDKIGVHTDLAFVLSEDGNSIEIHKVHVNTSARQDHRNAKGLRWSQYGLNCVQLDTVKDDDGNVIAVNGGTDVNEFDQLGYELLDRRQVLYLKECTADEIASKIINYAKAHKNICLLPLLDVARFFDMTMAQVIEQEGYELMRTIRVERHYDKNNKAEEADPQAGFVPCKYQITGDNDDHLVIDVKFEREKGTGKLKISYRGQSQHTKVNETKNISVDIFNNTKMYALSQTIIYTFAKKMHLSKARKFDRLLQYFCYQTGCMMVRCPQKKDEVLKSYKIWGTDKKSYFTVDITRIDVEKFNCVAEFDDGKVRFSTMDFQESIYTLYHQFLKDIMEVGSSDSAQ